MTIPDPFKSVITITLKEQAFIDKIGKQFENIFGIPRIGGRILGLLLIMPQPITIEQISNCLFISHGSICTNLRLLVLLGLIEKVTFLGERCDFYQYSSNAWDQVYQRSLKTIQDLRVLAHEGLDELSPEAIVCQRINDVATWSDLVFDMVNETSKAWKERH